MKRATIVKKTDKRFTSLLDFDGKDFMLISKQKACKIIKDMIDNNKVVICDIYDRDGKIGKEILYVNIYADEEYCEVVVNGNDKYKLYDRYLYNIIYDVKKDIYSLQIHDEYYEKIMIDNG